jgi:hypothetical protein
MSELSASAHVRLLIADYGVIDQQFGKITVVGGGISMVGTPPNSPNTAPFAILAVADFDPEHVGQRPVVELALEDEGGQLVPLPGAPGAPGATQFVRIASNDVLKPLDIPGVQIPADAIRPRVTLMLMLQNGLPLTAGKKYAWRLKIDGETCDEWTEPFYVPRPLFG